MSLPVLILLSLLTVQCGGCDLEVVKNVKTAIDANPNGFRTVFPKDYYVLHHYTKSMLRDTDPCCIFPAAIVLLESWNVLLRNLWDEHLNHSLIFDLKQTLDIIIKKNKNSEKLRYEMDPSQFSPLFSSPEELLKLTSELFTQWLEVGCSPSMEICEPPTLLPSAEKKEYSPSRVRLLTTRAIRSSKEETELARLRDVTPAPSGRGTASLSVHPASAWSLLLFRLYRWLLP
ncbi:uncharacterized protein zgc:174888 [Syngnathus typhle]|uniref:uncharacterized protein zgc:174888 n=1 Tax=Syngnathus typhle TaxID=161592 RepID=UPI002A6A26F1|nr:uncharacterized protein zgc:174888 [Syngnathus typhle]